MSAELIEVAQLQSLRYDEYFLCQNSTIRIGYHSYVYCQYTIVLVSDTCISIRSQI